jgi:hypothetical protein
MKEDRINIELMSDQPSLQRLSHLVQEAGRLLVCHRCHDIGAVIAGVLIIPGSEEAWVLCGPCMRQVPLEGRLAS